MLLNDEQLILNRTKNLSEMLSRFELCLSVLRIKVNMKRALKRNSVILLQGINVSFAVIYVILV